MENLLLKRAQKINGAFVYLVMFGKKVIEERISYNNYIAATVFLKRNGEYETIFHSKSKKVSKSKEIGQKLGLVCCE